MKLENFKKTIGDFLLHKTGFQRKGFIFQPKSDVEVSRKWLTSNFYDEMAVYYDFSR